MKKLSLLLALTLCLCSVGCNKATDGADGSTETNTANTTESVRETPTESTEELCYIPAPSYAAAEDYDYICEMAESDVRFKWVKAFIEKDIETCVDMVRTRSEEYWTERDRKYAEWFEYLDLIEIGDYSAEIGTAVDTFGYEYEYLMFSFEITDSDYDVFPVGTYSYRISEGVMSDAAWTRTDITEPEMDEWFEWSMLLYAHILTLDETSEYWDMASDAIFQIIHAESNVNGITTEEAFKTDAFAAFGIEDYVPNVYGAVAVDGGYTVRAGGGPVAHYRVDKVEQTGGTTDIYLQFYADPMNTVKAYYVKYSFEKIEGKYPYKLLSVDILDEGMYFPFYWKV